MAMAAAPRYTAAMLTHLNPQENVRNDALWLICQKPPCHRYQCIASIHC